MKAPRLLILGIIAAFMVVTVFHVQGYAATFEPADRAWLSISYALAVDASIVACAMLTRYAKTRGWAWAGFFVFVIASGLMNAAAIGPQTVYAWVYSLFPTAAIGLLGFLARQAEAVAEAQQTERAAQARADQERKEAAAAAQRERERVNAERRERYAAHRAAQLAASATQGAPGATQVSASATQVAPVKTYPCAECAQVLASPQRLASHVRHAHRNGHGVATEVRA